MTCERTWYQGTTTYALLGIEQHGLLPGDEVGQLGAWQNVPDSGLSGLVCLTSRIEVAEGYASECCTSLLNQYWGDEEGEDLPFLGEIVLCVAPVEALSPDPNHADALGEELCRFCHPGRIPPENVRIHDLSGACLTVSRYLDLHPKLRDPRVVKW